MYSSWTGTYSFVFELKTLLSAFRSYIDTVLLKIECIEARIEEIFTLVNIIIIIIQISRSRFKIYFFLKEKLDYSNN